jgi:hypothetical protein
VSAQKRVLLVPADLRLPLAMILIEPTCEGIQRAVGGYFEVIPVRSVARDAALYVDEEGIPKRLPLNQRLTAAIGIPTRGHRIYGDGFLATEVQGYEGPEISDMSPEELVYWLQWFVETCRGEAS